MDLPRVLLVEDNPLIQAAEQTLLAPCCTVVGIIDRAEMVGQTIDELYPDVVVLDVSLPGRSGLQVLREVREAYPHLGIVIATNHDEPAYKDAAFKRGADHFVLKNQLEPGLLKAVLDAFANVSSREHGLSRLQASS